MIITIAGKPGSGKTTVATMLAERLNFKYHSAGLYMKEMAAAKKLSLNKLIKKSVDDPTIDAEIDDWQRDLGKKENNFVMDSRLGFHFIPNSFKVFLDVEIDVSAERLFDDSHSGKLSLKETKEFIQERIDSEILRFSKRYHVNHFDFSHYNLVLVTSALQPERIVEEIVNKIK